MFTESLDKVLNFEGSMTLLRFVFLLFLSVFLLEIVRMLNKNINIDSCQKMTKKDTKKTAPPKEDPQIPTLVVLAGEKALGTEKGHGYQLPEQASIGRHSENFIVVEDPFASSFHTVIMKNRGKYLVSDMGSKNGTIVNGTPVDKEYELKEGDILEIGDVKFRFTRK